jgi:hypothetical protein
VALKREPTPLILAPRNALGAVEAPAPSDPSVRRSALIALGRACARIIAALPGERNDTRCRQCHYIGGIVARGDLDYGTAYDALVAAASEVKHDPPWPLRALERWVAQSIAAGMAQPLPLSEIEIWLRDFRARSRPRVRLGRAR